MYRTARTIANMTIKELALAAGVSHPTIIKLETGYELKPSTVRPIRAALEANNVRFVPHERFGEWAEPRELLGQGDE